MLTIGNKAKMKVHWKVSPYDFSQDKMKTIVGKMSAKYSIPKDNVKVIPDFVLLNEKGENVSVSHDVINNIQNPEFQLSLFKEFLEENKVQEYDFDYIKRIDAEINSKINYEVYDKYRRYAIKWIRWNNFLSYGEGNYFDFSALKGLVLLNGEPANQSGKTTFAIDLIHFLLFGRTEKSATQDKIFNKHLPEATEVVVEGCISVDGEDYIIKRRLTRPSLLKRNARSKTVQKVEYYKMVGDSMEELSDYVEDKQEENSAQTNKAIKEVIGNEEDFDMIICTTSSNLDDLIEKKETERGRLLSRWIGLLPIEQKDSIARDMFNSSVRKAFKGNIYDSQTLQDEIKGLNVSTTVYKGEIAKYASEIDKLDREYTSLEEEKSNLLLAKSKIDEDVLKIDIHTLQQKIETCKDRGIKKAQEKAELEERLKQLSDIDFSITEYNKLVDLKSSITVELNNLRHQFYVNKEQISSLKNGEYCPTCGRKYDNIDNSSKIKEFEDKNKELSIKGTELSEQLKLISANVEKMSSDSEKYKEKSKLEAMIPSLSVTISNLRNEYRELSQMLTDYNSNKEAIDRNNKLDISINNIKVKIQNNRNTKDTDLNFINTNKARIEENEKNVKLRENLIDEIKNEQMVEKNWKIYLDMVGKNGISKMVLRKTLPIINAQIARLLNGVCDFDVVIEITERNDVMFYLIKDGVKSDLTSGSGFEKTAAALAIRSVLGNISTLPKSNIFVVDEILGRVAKENFENMRTLYEKILENFDAVIQISHLEEIKDWHSTIITVKKENDVSKIVVSKETMLQ
jgi:DNA repair exonuclease SbcCD ATPase subunit